MLDIAPNNIEIDARAIVPCAAKGFKARRAINCARCPYFAGLALMIADDIGADITVGSMVTGRITWADKYAIRCCHVIERRTQIIEVIED